MVQLMNLISFRCNPSLMDSDDKFAGDFRQILELAEEVVAAEKSGPAYKENWYAQTKASFTLGIGIVQPLYIVATTCRDRKLRRDAIRLLMHRPRREGLWDSMLCARIAQRAMGIDEEGMMSFCSSIAAARSIVPYDKRVMIEEVSFDLQQNGLK
jgi:hypothetical protein